jgi:2-isopropylmalate synthase
MLEEITGIAVQPNKAIIGRNAFAHEAGIHQDGMLKNRLTYEIMTPQSVGVPDSKLVLGKHSGRHALSLRCEQLGHHFERRELDEIYRRFVVLADQIKNVHDHHLLELIREIDAESHRIPPGRVEAEAAAAAAAGAEHRRLFPGAIPTELSAASLPVHGSEHQPDQEDYLWGV